MVEETQDNLLFCWVTFRALDLRSTATRTLLGRWLAEVEAMGELKRISAEVDLLKRRARNSGRGCGSGFWTRSIQRQRSKAQL
jgi:hypothetical protein